MRTMWILALAAALGHAPAEEGRLSRVVGVSKTTLGKAIAIALVKVPGEALKAEIERDNGKPVIEVTISAHEEIFEVEIDGETGAVLKVEEEEDDDTN